MASHRKKCGKPTTPDRGHRTDLTSSGGREVSVGCGTVARPWWDRQDAEALAPLDRDWIRVRCSLPPDPPPSGMTVIAPRAEFHPPAAGGACPFPSQPTWGPE